MKINHSLTAGISLALILLCSCDSLELPKFSRLSADQLTPEIVGSVREHTTISPSSWGIVLMKGALDGKDVLEISDSSGLFSTFTKQNNEWLHLSDRNDVSALASVLTAKLRRLFLQQSTLKSATRDIIFGHCGSRGVLASDELLNDVDASWEVTVKGGAERLRNHCKPIIEEISGYQVRLNFNVATRFGSVEKWLVLIDISKPAKPQITSIQINELLRRGSFDWGYVP